MKSATRLAHRAAKSPSIHFQFGNIALMLFQSFVAPFIIGVDSFGSQMLFLAPVLFAQALLEPSFQSEFNAGARDKTTKANLSSILLQSVLLMVLAISVTIGDFDRVALGALAFFYVLYTAVTSAAFATRQIHLATAARYISLVAYIAAFAAVASLGLDFPIIAGNLAGFAVASVVIGTILVKRRTVSLRWSRPDFGTLMGGLSFRLPTICITGLATVILGYAGASATAIGEFRIFVAAVTAGRFANIVPLAELQAAIHRYYTLRDAAEIKPMLKRYIASVVVFAAALSLAFPALYEWAFGRPTFDRTSLLLASLFVVAQPMAYAILVRSQSGSWFSAALAVGLSAALMISFYGLFVLSGSATFAVSLTISALVAAYALLIYAIRPLGKRQAGV